MRKMLLALIASGVATVALAGDRTVVVPLGGDKATTVQTTEYIRIPASTNAGGTIKVESKGPVKLAAETVVLERTGNSNVVGKLSKEYDYKPTGKGKVTIVVSTTLPGQEASPTKTTYEIEVK